VVDNAALVFDQAATGTYAGIISGTGSLTKQNAGTLILTGANSYAGGTTITAGTLFVGPGAAIGSGPVRLSGGTLDVTVVGSAQTINGLSGTAGTLAMGATALT